MIKKLHATKSTKPWRASQTVITMELKDRMNFIDDAIEIALTPSFIENYSRNDFANELAKRGYDKGIALSEIDKLKDANILTPKFRLTDNGYLIWAQGGVNAIYGNHKLMKKTLDWAIKIGITSIIISLISLFMNCA